MDEHKVSRKYSGMSHHKWDEMKKNMEKKKQETLDEIRTPDSFEDERGFYGHVLPNHFKKTNIINTHGR